MFTCSARTSDRRQITMEQKQRNSVNQNRVISSRRAEGESWIVRREFEFRTDETIPTHNFITLT